MGWAALVPLVAQYGLPFAEYIVQLVQGGKDATPEDFAKLRTLQSETALYHLQMAATKLGLPSTDPRIIELAKLLPS